MKASMRCKHTFQGDRCRKEVGHDSNLRLSPDPWHQGQNQRWNEEKNEELHPASRFNRGTLRGLRNLVSRNSNPRGLSKGQRQAANLVLNEVIKFVKEK